MVKLDLGSKTTGVAITLNGAHGTKVVFLGEMVHKPDSKTRLDVWRALRRGRRGSCAVRTERVTEARSRRVWKPAWTKRSMPSRKSDAGQP